MRTLRASFALLCLLASAGQVLAEPVAVSTTIGGSRTPTTTSTTLPRGVEYEIVFELVDDIDLGALGFLVDYTLARGEALPSPSVSGGKDIWP